MVTRCEACGGGIKEGQRFCTFCGTQVASGPSASFGPSFASAAYLGEQAITPSWAHLAGAGRRVAAYLIDSLIVTVIGGAIFGILSGALGVNEGFTGVLVLAAVLAYFIGLEGRRGQTLGKQTLQIRVVRQADGQPITMGQSVVRNLLRVIDALPFWNLLGFLLITFQAQKQRVGDLAAKTVVIIEQ